MTLGAERASSSVRSLSAGAPTKRASCLGAALSGSVSRPLLAGPATPPSAVRHSQRGRVGFELRADDEALPSVIRSPPPRRLRTDRALRACSALRRCGARRRSHGRTRRDSSNASGARRDRRRGTRRQPRLWTAFDDEQRIAERSRRSSTLSSTHSSAASCRPCDEPISASVSSAAQMWHVVERAGATARPSSASDCGTVESVDVGGRRSRARTA